MQALDALTLKHLARELHSWLSGAKVNKIQQLSRQEFSFHLWGGKQSVSRNHPLYVQLNPEGPFCALLSAELLKELVTDPLEKPTGFCMLLRKHLVGAMVTTIETLPGERVMNVYFETFNELGNRVRLILSLELMGKQTNMLLVDDVQGIILGSAHVVTETMSSQREVSPGLSYAPPPAPPGKILPESMSRELFLEVFERCPNRTEALPSELSSRVMGLSQRLVEDMLSNVPMPEKNPDKVFALLEAFIHGTTLSASQHLDNNSYSLIPFPSSSKHGETGTGSPRKFFASVHEMVADYYTGNYRRKRIDTVREQLLAALKRLDKKTTARKQELTPVDDTVIGDFQKLGNLILTAHASGNLPTSPISGELLLDDYETGQPVKLSIDPTLSWTENADLYFRRARKAKSRRDNFREQSEELVLQQAYLDDLSILVKQAEDIPALIALRENFIEEGLIKSGGGKTRQPQASSKQRQGTISRKGHKASGGKKPSGVLHLTSSESFELWVGRTGQANGELSGKLAKPEDVWLHVHEMPGSHVLIKTGKQPVPDPTLWEAANLAVWYSTARDSKNVPVVYTESRYVRKIAGSYPGHVTYKNEQTIFVTPDPELIQRLLMSDC